MARLILISAMVVCLAGRIFAAATNAAALALTPEEAAWSQNVADSYKTLQEQQEATLRAVQQSREEAQANVKRTTEALESRLNQLEQAVVNQRAHEVETLSGSHRFTLTVVGLFAGGAFVGLLIFAFCMLRAMNRRSMAVPMQTVAGPIPVGQLGGGETGLTTLDPALQGGARLRSSLDRLEQRLNELETVAQPPASTEDAPATVSKQIADLSSRIALLLGKGQALLNLQQVDTALACYDEVIALDPTNAEAFVKKGAALEKLGRLDEAIDCYDRTIALDTSMTMAYLCKGGVFNRQERYAEALQCYEQALRAHQKTGA